MDIDLQTARPSAFPRRAIRWSSESGAGCVVTCRVSALSEPKPSPTCMSAGHDCASARARPIGGDPADAPAGSKGRRRPSYEADHLDLPARGRVRCAGGRPARPSDPQASPGVVLSVDAFQGDLAELFMVEFGTAEMMASFPCRVALSERSRPIRASRAALLPARPAQGRLAETEAPSA